MLYLLKVLISPSRHTFRLNKIHTVGNIVHVYLNSHCDNLRYCSEIKNYNDVKVDFHSQCYFTNKGHI